MERVDYIRMSRDMTNLKVFHCDKCKKIIDFDSLIPNTITGKFVVDEKANKVYCDIFCFENRDIPNNLSRNKPKKYKRSKH